MQKAYNDMWFVITTERAFTRAFGDSELLYTLAGLTLLELHYVLSNELNLAKEKANT